MTLNGRNFSYFINNCKKINKGIINLIYGLLNLEKVAIRVRELMFIMILKIFDLESRVGKEIKMEPLGLLFFRSTSNILSFTMAENLISGIFCSSPASMASLKPIGMDRGISELRHLTLVSGEDQICLSI